jgi:tetratricopeptide (TPR) repeat protein
MRIFDGHQTALTQPDLHWAFARQLMDLVAGPGSIKPSPGGDNMARRWYIATTAWMQVGGHHDNRHLNHGREIFPDDPELAMLAGAQHEAYATPSIQTAVRSAFLPTGVRLDVGSERNELRDAEKDLRRAVELKPDFAEAQIRLGRVLSQTGRDGEAVDHLRRGLEATQESLLVYYGSLFLGAAEEKLGHGDAAKGAYERAAALYPAAQSPLLGLSELARRAGHRDDALKAMEKVYGIKETSPSDADPWWRYTYVQGRNADELIDALQKPFRLADPR